MVRSTCLAVDAGLPDVLQTPLGWQEGPGPGGEVPGLRPRRTLPRAGAADRCTWKVRGPSGGRTRAAGEASRARV